MLVSAVDDVTGTKCRGHWSNAKQLLWQFISVWPRCVWLYFVVVVDVAIPCKFQLQFQISYSQPTTLVPSLGKTFLAASVAVRRLEPTEPTLTVDGIWQLLHLCCFASRLCSFLSKYFFCSYFFYFLLSFGLIIQT